MSVNILFINCQIWKPIWELSSENKSTVCRKQAQDRSVEMTKQAAVLGQERAKKCAWLPSINMQFKTINAR